MLSNEAIQVRYTIAPMQNPGKSVLISEQEIQRRVAEMGVKISEDYKGQSLTVVGILKGSFIFIADLIRHIDPAIPVEVEFMTVSSYGSGTVSSGELRIEQDRSRVAWRVRMFFSWKTSWIRDLRSAQ